MTSLPRYADSSEYRIAADLTANGTAALLRAGHSEDSDLIVMRRATEQNLRRLAEEKRQEELEWNEKKKEILHG